jgi:PAS domain S-box-containing protein
MLGYDTFDQIAGMPILELVHPDDHPSVTARISHTAQHGGGAPGVARMRRRDGAYVALEGEATVLDFDGQASHVVIGRDVTERRELFARMALADRLLSVGTLAAGVAHEINNPLAYVSSNLELLFRELPLLLAGAPSQIDRAEVEQLLADAREGAERVGAIVRDLRALSRGGEGGGSVDIATVLASCMKIAHNEIRHRARVVSTIDDGLPAVVGTDSRLGQVFLNLLVNAAQAIPEGRVEANEIRVRAFAAPDTGQVVVEIEDTGVGIPTSVIGRIFDPFFTTKPVGVGVGLGLAISHEIVRVLGGTIRVDSTVDRGSTFRVALPIATAQATVSPAQADRGPVSVARVLVIDDEQAVGRSIAMLLAPEYDVTCATRAKDALARLGAGERYDAIVCDVMMPEMTGIDFYEQLGAIAPEEQRRIVFLTGGAFTPQARDFLAAADRPHLDKPFSERDLRRAIEAARASS